jgi:hypothetical protein
MYAIVLELDKIITLFGEDNTADIAHESGRVITVERSAVRHDGGVRLRYRISDSDEWMWLFVTQDLCVTGKTDDHAMLDNGLVVHPNDPAVWTQFHACFPTFPHIHPAE